MTVAGPAAGVGYAPGTWVGMAGSELWLLADVDPAGAVVQRCWHLITGGADEDEVLGAILQAGFRSVGSFALVRRLPEGTHVIVRGAARVELETPAGAVEVATAGAADWADRQVAGEATGVRLVGAAVGDGGDAPLLPVAGGVVLASAIGITLTGSPAAAVPVPPAASTPDPLVVPASLWKPASSLTSASAEKPASRGKQPDQAEPAARYGHMFGIAESPAPTPSPAPLLPPTDPAATPTALGDLSSTLAPPSDVSSTLAPPSEWSSTLPPFTTTDIRPVPAPDPVAAPPAPAGTGLITAVPWAVVPGHPVAPAAAPRRTVDGPRATEVDRAGAVEDDDPQVTTVRRRGPAQTMPAGPTVSAVDCPAGHPNPAGAIACRVCGATVAHQVARDIPRPILGTLRLSSGDVIALDRGVLLGRAPDPPAGSPREQPHIVRLPSPDNDISRNHVEVRLDGWQVSVVDLGSTNGTYVALPGREFVRLPAHGEQTMEPGTVVSLSEKASFTFEVTG